MGSAVGSGTESWKRSAAGAILAWGLAALAPGHGVLAEEPTLALDNAQLVDIHAGSPLSDFVRRLKVGGYELADGTNQDFAQWYDSRWRDLSVSFLTQVDDGFGLYWGFSSGERGAKYVIQPGAKLGFILQEQLSPETTLTLSGIVSLWGRLKERPCLADYGEIGGIQKVNCRLAATPMPPSQTLDHLLDEAPPDWAQFSLTWAFRF